jgi:hypothetical protein
MRVSSTCIAWSNENNWTRVTWELTSDSLHESSFNFDFLIKREQELHDSWHLTRESLHESFLNFHCLIKREQELHESWQARVYMRVFSTCIAWSNENNWTRVTWELTSESLHESFLNFHCLIKREQELHENLQARVYMRISSTFIACSNENKSFIHENWQARVYVSDSTFIAWSNENKVVWELTRESLYENFLNFLYGLFEREHEFCCFILARGQWNFQKEKWTAK